MPAVATRATESSAPRLATALDVNEDDERLGTRLGVALQCKNALDRPSARLKSPRAPPKQDERPRLGGASRPARSQPLMERAGTSTRSMQLQGSRNTRKAASGYPPYRTWPTCRRAAHHFWIGTVEIAFIGEPSITFRLMAT